jgi:hypothetical protein
MMYGVKKASGKDTLQHCARFLELYTIDWPAAIGSGILLSWYAWQQRTRIT